MRAYVFGAGGHAKVVVGTLLELGAVVEGLFDDQPDMWGKDVLGAKILGPITEATQMKGEVGVIAVGDNLTRSRLARLLKGWKWITIVHPKAWVHSSVQLGPGTVVFAGGIIQPNVRVGAHCIVNTGATVDHDCVLDDFVHVAPGVHLGGNVFLGEGVLVGIGGVIIPGRCIGEWSTVGAGSAVINDVPRRSTLAGVPAKIITEGSPP
jgi:sugar O-acyltransferase (sialic acid O-acetyltransferase NeuD family)